MSIANIYLYFISLKSSNQFEQILQNKKANLERAFIIMKLWLDDESFSHFQISYYDVYAYIEINIMFCSVK